MSTTAVADVVDRTMTDEAFLDRYRGDPGGALEEYDLAEEERTALLSGEDRRVDQALGGMRMDEVDVAVVVVVT